MNTKTAEEIRDEQVEKYSFQVPYNGSNEFYNKEKAKAFTDGWDACYAQFQHPVPAKEYPIGGYAPGNYMCNCTTCKAEFFGDKLAVQCESCAIKMAHPVPDASQPAAVPDEAGEVKLKDVLLKYEIEFNRIGYTENAVEENSLLQAMDEYGFKISHNKNLEIMRLNGIIGKQQDSFNKLSDELKANYEIAQNPFTKRGIKIALKLFSKWILS